MSFEYYYGYNERTMMRLESTIVVHPLRFHFIT